MIKKQGRRETKSKSTMKQGKVSKDFQNNELRERERERDELERGGLREWLLKGGMGRRFGKVEQN